MIGNVVLGNIRTSNLKLCLESIQENGVEQAVHSVCPEPSLASQRKHHMQFFISHSLETGSGGPPGVMATVGKVFFLDLFIFDLGQNLSAESPQYSLRTLVLILSLEPDLGIKICRIFSMLFSCVQHAREQEAACVGYPGVSTARHHSRAAGGAALGWGEARRSA